VIYENVGIDDLGARGIQLAPGDQLLGATIHEEMPSPDGRSANRRFRVTWACCGEEGVITAAGLRDRVISGNRFCRRCAAKMTSSRLRGRPTQAAREILALADEGATAREIARLLGHPRGLIDGVLEARRARENRAKRLAEVREATRQPAQIPVEVVLEIDPVQALAMSRPWGRATRRGYVGAWDRAA